MDNRQHVSIDQAAPELHRLKIDAQPMSDLLSGNKTFEIRNDDRGFSVGNHVHLVCADGRETDRTISHIPRGYGLSDGLCVLSYRAISPPPLRLPRSRGWQKLQTPSCATNWTR
ncbi:DUF3850 domain-containing protein [Paracoccus cavernae]|uniref:DUF3850 domain-containing protein n=1 Tax=Paracoccus cavernae TaxID=1571207 RepID=UPI0035F26409